MIFDKLVAKILLFNDYFYRVLISNLKAFISGYLSVNKILLIVASIVG